MVAVATTRGSDDRGLQTGGSNTCSEEAEALSTVADGTQSPQPAFPRWPGEGPLSQMVLKGGVGVLTTP